MGWTVLYIAFGIVALWLLGEVLLQYKARLRWRLLAFGGFLGVVLGVLIPSVIVIGLGAAAFAVGQTYVTLSFRRGFAAGWAVGNRPRESGGSKRRRGEAARQEPTLEVTDLQPTAAGTYRQEEAYDPDHDDVFSRPQAAETAAESTAVYEPQPLPDDTGTYGVYSDTAYAAATDPSYAAAAQAPDQNFAYDGYAGYDQQQYGYDNGQQQYAAYSDPYIGTQTYGGGSYDASYGGQQQYGQQVYGQDSYATGTYGGETPPGGVWVPQQRTTDDAFGGELPPEQPYPYQGNGGGNGNAQGYDEQYRF
ncbi:SCO2102 family sporulation regulator [Streptomyces avermitilis]|uniref:SCO2102 family sporulation regulator n=1 Tax=Streptomyces avermitilis TaxID=33903 RepID=UPI0033CDF379